MSPRWWFHRRSQPATHPAEFASTVVHFTLTAQAVGELDIVRGARKLLASDLAISAAWPSEEHIRVAKRFRPLARSIRRFRALVREYEAAKDAGTWPSAARLLMRHPRVGLLHVRGLLVPRLAADLDRLLAQNTLRALLAFSIKHPIAAVRHVLPNIRFERTSSSVDAEGEPPSIRPSPEEDVDGGRTPQDGAVEDVDEKPTAIVDDVERTILAQQWISAVERRTDALLFGGQDRDEDRFVRVQLRNSYHDFVVPGSDRVEHVVFEPRLLLHDSGVMQLDLRLSTESPLGADDVVALMDGSAPRIVRSSMPMPLVAGSEWEAIGTVAAEDVDAGQPLVTVDHDAPVSMLEVLFVHLSSATAAIGRRHDAWIHYPTAFVKPSGCCEPTAWRVQHLPEVQRIAYRMSGPSRTASHVPFPVDLSMHAEHSLFAALGSALYVKWDGDLPRPIDELFTTLIIEYALVTYMRLQSMELLVSRMDLRERELRRRYHEAIRLFSELRQGTLRSGEARDIADHVLATLGADRIRPTIEVALALAGQAHSTINASRSSRRAWWLAYFATVIAALVAVPTLLEFFRVLDAEPVGGPAEPLLGPLRWFGSLGVVGPWALIAAVVLVSLVVALVAWVWRSRPRRLPSLRRGFVWPKQPTFVTDSDEMDGADVDGEEVPGSPRGLGGGLPGT